MQGSLSGKVAWVTGASGGIGSSIVEKLHEAGCTVLSTDLAGEPAVTGERIVHRRCDVTLQADIDATVQVCRRELGGLDILVNNAGILNRVDVFDVTRELWAKVMAVNLEAYFFCAQAAARAMRERGGGSIINTVSINADLTSAITLPYCTSKGGVRTLTFALAVALGEYGIRVNGIAPGTIVTGMNLERWKTPGAVEAVTGRTPLGRLGVPDDIGPAVVFLASDEASFVTGSILPINGGRSAILAS